MKYFKIEEIVDRETFETLGEDAWQLFNTDALIALDGLREFLNTSITVNDWSRGGSMQWRGFRSNKCPIGATKSQHRLGNAFDCTIKGYTAAEARSVILAHQDDPLLERITRMEDKVSWLHFDLMELPANKERIYLFKA
jgi:hypothetical protein